MHTARRDIETLFRAGALGNVPDRTLLERFLADRDEAAFGALIERHGPMVWGVCRRVLGDHHDAEDAFQAAFLVLARKAGSVRGCETVGPWLHGVALRTARKARATSSRRRAREAPITREPEAGPAPLGPGSDLPSILDDELSRLPERQRSALVLCDLEGWTRREAAAQLGWREGTVASRLARGRALLAARLKRRGVAPGALAAPLAAGVPPGLATATVGAARAIGTGPGVVSAMVGGMVQILGWNKAPILATALAIGVVGAGLASFGPDPGPPGRQEQADPPKRRDRTPPIEADRERTRAALGSVLDRAAQVVPKVENLEQRVWIWCAVARLQRIGGLDAALKETLDRAVRAAEETESDHRRMDVAEALAEAGRLDAALAMIAPVRIESNRDLARARIAAARARSGDIAGALRIATTSRDAAMMGEALRSIAGVRADRGDFPGAMTTAKLIGDPADRAFALAALATGQVRSNDPMAAETMAKARAAADLIPEAARAPAFAEIAGVLAGLGNADEAMRVAERVADPTWGDVAWKNIAIALAGRGELGPALRAAGRIREGYERGESRKSIVAALVLANDLDGARREADAIEHPSPRVEALAAVARGQARAGRRDDAEATFAEARRLADEIKDAPRAGNLRPAAFGQIARAQAEIGEQDVALAWIDEQPSHDVKVWSWIGLAEGLAERLPAGPPLPVASEPAPITTGERSFAIAPARQGTGSFRGKIILFGASRFARPEVSAIEAIDPDGRNAETLLALPGEKRGIEAGRVSPDGTRLAYTLSPGPDATGPAELRVLSADGGTRTIAPAAFVRAWSPDGARLAAIRVRRKGEYESFLIEVDGGKTQPLPFPPADVVDDWSPDGARLAVMAGNPGRVFEHPTKGTYPLRQVDLAKPDGSDRRRATEGPSLDSIQARFSPDGRSLAYHERRHRDGRVLHFAVVLDLATGRPRDLASFDEVYAGNKEYRPHHFPAWSPDGASVAYIVPRRKVQSSETRPELLIVSVATGETTRLDLAGRGIRWVQAIDWR